MDNQRAFSCGRLAKLFNEWMRQYTEDPTSFEAEFKIVGTFLQELGADKEPTYGDGCVRVLMRIEDELITPTVKLDAAPLVAALNKGIWKIAKSRRKPTRKVKQRR